MVRLSTLQSGVIHAVSTSCAPLFMLSRGVRSEPPYQRPCCGIFAHASVGRCHRVERKPAGHHDGYDHPQYCTTKHGSRSASNLRSAVMDHRHLFPYPGGAARIISRRRGPVGDRKSTRLNSSHVAISYAVFCLKKKKTENNENP